MAALTKLSTAFVIEVSGRDCERYLNARLTNDIRALGTGQSFMAAALTPQGRAQGLFTVYRQERERFLLISDGGEREKVLAALMRFKVADRVDARITDLVLLHGSTGGLSDVPCIPKQRTETLGFDCLVTTDQLEAYSDQLLADGEGQYQESRLFYGYPVYPDEINEDTMFSESGFESALSRSKGCYVGQEVIEKASAMGKIPRALYHAIIDAPEPLSPGADVMLGGVASGRIVSSCTSRSRNATAFFCLVRRQDENIELVLNDGISAVGHRVRR